ncbi:MAG: HAD-IB family hydrolase, partial [Akkermansiaceae bacterium]|nr:HAD-IB family hydrolase [Akkermansiaceae bacterium]
VAEPRGSWQAPAALSMSPPSHIPTEKPRDIALFDLDGTLLAWDCQLLFRHFVVRREPWRIGFLKIFLLLAPLAKLIGTEGMKRVFLSYLWKMDREALDNHAAEFAEELMPAIYPEVKAKLDEHREQGHFTVLTSASPEFYVREIGERLGFDLVLGTEIEFGALFPDLENHKGAVKVWRLRQLLPADWFDANGSLKAHGYTDSTADLPLLTLCDRATVVNPGERLTQLAEEKGWNIVRPKRPWKNRRGFALRALALLFGLGRDPGGLDKS